MHCAQDVSGPTAVRAYYRVKHTRGVVKRLDTTSRDDTRSNYIMEWSVPSAYGPEEVCDDSWPNPDDWEAENEEELNQEIEQYTSPKLRHEKSN